MAKSDVVIKIDGDSSGLEKAIEASESAVKDLSKTSQSAVGTLDKFTGGLATKFVQARAGIGTLIKGLNLTKVAIAATGVGALVIAFTALLSYFTKTKRGAELLERVTASLGAVMGVLTDTLSTLGEFLVNVFTSPKKTITDLGNTVKTYVTDKVTALIDGLGLLGTAIEKAFNRDFKGAADAARQGVAKLGEGVAGLNPLTAVAGQIAGGFSDIAGAANEAAEKAFELKAAEQALADSRRQTLVDTAKQRAEIKQLNLIAEDTTKGIQERIDAAERAGQIESELLAQRTADAQEALRIRKEQNALSESSAEDLQAEAELEAALYDLQRESLELQTTIQNKRNTLVAEDLRNRQEIIDAEIKAKEDADALAAAEVAAEAARREAVYAAEKQLLDELNQLDETATERAIRLAEEEYERRLLMAGENAELQLQVEQQYLASIAEIEEQARTEKADAEAKARDAETKAEKEEMDKRLKAAEELEAAKRKITADTFTVLNSLNQLFNNGQEKRARKAFTIQKTLGIAQATIATYQAVADALAKDSVAPLSRYVSAAAAGAIGAAQVAGIARQKYGGGGSVETSVQAPNLSQPQTTPGVPNFQVPTQDAFRSYVLATDVNTAQQASQKVKDQSLLLG